MTITNGALPPPRIDGDVSLEEAIWLRRSVRSYRDQTLDINSLSQILWAAQGVHRSSGYRNAPSAGARYPLELYIVSSDAIFHYVADDHSLEFSRKGDYRAALMQAALDQEFLLQAAITIVIAAVAERTVKKYGEQRSPRYIDFEVGHVAQNIMLQSSALGLGSVPVGAFKDVEIAKILDLPGNSSPLYLIPIGYPAS